MIGETLIAYPIIVSRSNDDNPIFQSIADTLEKQPIYVRDVNKTTRILDFLRISKKPSLMAHLQDEELPEVVRLVDNLYVAALEKYQQSLNSAIALDEFAYQNWTPIARELIAAEIYRMTNFENYNRWLPEKMSLFFWGVWGAFVGSLDPTLETRRAVRLVSASENRRMWLHQVDILEQKRVRESQVWLNLRISTLKQEISDLEVMGVQDQILASEKNQLEAILNIFTTATIQTAHVQTTLKERNVTPYSSCTSELRPIDIYIVFLSSLILSGFVYFILPQNHVLESVTSPGYIYSSQVDVEIPRNTYRAIAAIAILVLWNIIPMMNPMPYISLRESFSKQDRLNEP